MTPTRKIHLQRLIYSHYEHADLEKFAEFAKDFGLVTVGEDQDSVYYRGYGKDPICYIASRPQPGQKPKFRGPGLMARTKADFDNACKIEGAVVHNISKRPGGGQMVVVPDLNGFEVNILWAVQDKPVTASEASSSHYGEKAYNGAFEKNRRGMQLTSPKGFLNSPMLKQVSMVGGFKRLKKGPAMVHKLGHFGYLTPNFEATCDWYKATFNFMEIDVMHAPDNDEIILGRFYRLDLGEEYVDHHSLLITRGEGSSSYPHHSSFEVEDFDTQLLGHDWLTEKNYELVWGVGRHIYGSQVFDYWRDTSDYIVEHYADGDLVNCHTAVEHGKMGVEGAIWGPGAPSFKPRAKMGTEQVQTVA